MTLLQILTYISENKTVITGAVGCIGETTVILWNLWRHAQAERAKLEAALKKALEDLQKALEEKASHVAESKMPCAWDDWVEVVPLWRKVLWSANPINLFRKPNS